MSSEKVKVEIEGVTYVPESSISTLTKVKEIDGKDSVWVIGKKYLIRTVTMILLGKLENITNQEFVLSEACWVADTGRFNEALSGGPEKLKEIEMLPGSVIVGRGSLIDACEWNHNLPKVSK